METIDVLKQCYCEGDLVKLPPINLPRDEYEAIKKALEGIGGKWKGGKVGGFQFKYNPAGLLEQLQNGEEINLKQAFQFFATPSALSDRLVELAELNHGLTILEPSAGQGGIVNAIRRYDECALVDCFELMPSNRSVLQSVTGVNLIGEDFMHVKAEPRYDRILANPPFTKGQDTEHIRRMYDWLTPEGRLVSVASTSWKTNTAAKPTAFRQWLNEVNAKQILVPAGTFKESGTAVETCIIIIDKAGRMPPCADLIGIDEKAPERELYIPEPPKSVEELLADIERIDRELIQSTKKLTAMIREFMGPPQKAEVKVQPTPQQLQLFA